MAFFKSLFKKEEPAPVTLSEDFPDLYNGMKVEVLTPANALIFVGRIRLLTGNQVDVLGETGGFLPRALYNQRVKAFLCKGALRSPYLTYPNAQWGYGRLNLCGTMSELVNHLERGL